MRVAFSSKTPSRQPATGQPKTSLGNLAILANQGHYVNDRCSRPTSPLPDAVSRCLDWGAVPRPRRRRANRTAENGSAQPVIVFKYSPIA